MDKPGWKLPNDPKEVLDRIRKAVDELDDLVDAAGKILPPQVRIFVPLVDAFRRAIDVLDDLVDKKKP